MPSLLSRVIESQGQDVEISSIRDQVQSSTGDEGWPSTHMVVFGIGTGCGSLVDRSERGDPQGIPLLPIYCASRWQEDVP